MQLTWTLGQHGPLCDARDGRGTYRIELVRQDGGLLLFLPGVPGVSAGIDLPAAAACLPSLGDRQAQAGDLPWADPA